MGEELRFNEGQI